MYLKCYGHLIVEFSPSFEKYTDFDNHKFKFHIILFFSNELYTCLLLQHKKDIPFIEMFFTGKCSYNYMNIFKLQ